MVDKTNLLEETINVINLNHHNPSEVEWVGNLEGTNAITWTKFTKLADKDYDSDFGTQEVYADLVVVGGNWWLERHEYDGSEWWEYKELPKLQHMHANYKQIFYKEDE